MERALSTRAQVMSVFSVAYNDYIFFSECFPGKLISFFNSDGRQFVSMVAVVGKCSERE